MNPLARNPVQSYWMNNSQFQPGTSRGTQLTNRRLGNRRPRQQFNTNFNNDFQFERPGSVMVDQGYQTPAQPGRSAQQRSQRSQNQQGNNNIEADRSFTMPSTGRPNNLPQFGNRPNENPGQADQTYTGLGSGGSIQMPSIEGLSDDPRTQNMQWWIYNQEREREFAAERRREDRNTAREASLFHSLSDLGSSIGAALGGGGGALYDPEAWARYAIQWR
jgi:hypothetical protein